jgi:hypothetical protein
MNRLDKAVLSYITTTSNLNDVDLRVEEHHGDKYLVAYVDVEKIDKNSPKYDQSYREKLIRERKVNQPTFVVPRSSLELRLSDAEKFFGQLKYKTAFLPKNYEFLNDIEKKVQDAVKQINPEFDAGMSWDSDYPKPILSIYLGGFKNYDGWFKPKYGHSGSDFIEDIEKIIGNNTSLNQYKWSITNGKKKAD